MAIRAPDGANNTQHRMVLQLITEFNSYSLFSDTLVFVYLCLCLCPCLSPCICLVYLYYGFHDIFPKFSLASTHSPNISRSWHEYAMRVEGGAQWARRPSNQYVKVNEKRKKMQIYHSDHCFPQRLCKR